MPIESPVLDDLDFRTVEALLRTQIPLIDREWTDHNESDPGITLIQLFAYLAEQIAYRLNRVPEKNYIEFLKLIGIRLRPARPATTTMMFVLTKPETTEAFLIPAGARIRARSERGEPPVFEVDRGIDALPAQLAALVTTSADGLTQINATGESGPTAAGAADPTAYVAARFSLAWDGRTPKLKDMPTQPIALFSRPSEQNHRYLWIGLAFNPSLGAGFRGARATLHLQLDDDEQPAPDASAICGGVDAELVDLFDPDDDLIEYSYYRPPPPGVPQGGWQPLSIIGDETQGWTRSGRIVFDVPLRLGAIPDAEWRGIEAGMRHPLIAALKNPVEGAPGQVPISGWIRVRFKTVVPAVRLRALSFNVGAATNAETVRNEQLGVGGPRQRGRLAPGTGEPGQRVRLAHGNVLPHTLDIVTIGTGPTAQPWSRVETFDTSGPADFTYLLDAEAGEIIFGDGIRGRPPRETEQIVAVAYRHGGGTGGEVAAGLVNRPDSLPAPVEAAVNVVAARGGRNAETLDEAKLRAPAEITVRSRAVTAEDFAFLARQTSQVRVRRAVVVPLHRPYPRGSTDGPGLDLEMTAAGVVSVIVVPDEAGAYPTPTEGMLRAVAQHLDQYRLITTEVYVTVPQYVRLFELDISITIAAGFTRSQVREAVVRHLEGYFHVLTGGPDGQGFPFGSTLHHADLLAQVYRVDGVERVERLTAMYDGNAPANAPQAMAWRDNRLTPRRLTNCTTDANDDERIELATDETVFVDAGSLVLRLAG